jgi:gas vesicle protein
MRRENNTVMKAALLLTVGGMAGAAMALLLAPHSGQKTRRHLQRAGRNLAERAEQFREELGECLEDLMEDSLEIADQGLYKGKKITDKFRKDMVPVLEAGQDMIRRQIERANNLIHQ